MPQYVTSPDAEVAGVAVLSLLNNIQVDELLPVLKKHGLEQIDPNGWYSEQKLLDVVKDIQENPNSMQNFVAIGMKVFETMPLPPGVDSLQSFLGAIPAILQAISRNSVGIQVEVGQNSARVINTSPYPDDLIYGELWGICRRFLPNGKFSIMPLPQAANDPVKVFEVKW
jgi:hypothetical protein